jgi:hypothetical protein
MSLILAVMITPASVQDRDAARLLIQELVNRYGRLQIIWADGGYLGALVTDPYTATEVNTHCDELLSQWNLLDDAEYPWRSDSGFNRGPLVTLNERGATRPGVGFDLINVGTAEIPNWQPPPDTNAPP